MDENKLKKLRSIDYVIQPTCETCVHGDFKGKAQVFGTCKIHTYDHLKHSDSTRQLSIHAHGHCSEYKANPTSSVHAALGAWVEFAVEGEERTWHTNEELNESDT